ncbi:I78 family peptidase inhibitor [Actinomadura fulvescens]|uniref:Peptidase inhibitor I78 family protein n=1 Tax=Actinomadura fulvescens TaxID=46160 RepID=A0ABN3QX43_9ACTN
MRVPSRRMLVRAGSVSVLSTAFTGSLLGPAQAQAANPIGACDALRLSPQLLGTAMDPDPKPLRAGEIEVQSKSILRSIRILRPGQHEGLGFVADRLTVVVDKTDHVTRVFCG